MRKCSDLTKVGSVQRADGLVHGGPRRTQPRRDDGPVVVAHDAQRVVCVRAEQHKDERWSRARPESFQSAHSPPPAAPLVFAVTRAAPAIPFSLPLVLVPALFPASHTDTERTS